MATAKHFIGDGGTFKGIDKGDTRINESGLKISMEAYMLPLMHVFNQLRAV